MPVVKDRDIFQSYKLRRLALELEQFTVNELRAVAGTEKETIESFIFNLKQEIPGAFRQETLKAHRVGRPVTRYRLTPEAMHRLAVKNAALGRQLSVGTYPKEASIRVLEATAAPEMAVPGENVASWLNSLVPDLTYALDEGAMLTVKPSQAVTAQHGSVVTPLAEQITFTMEEIVKVIKKLLTPWQQVRLEKQGWTAGSYAIEGHPPVYLQVETEAGRPTLKVRPLAGHIPTTQELRLPALAEKISTMKAGLVLVTGIIGSGRSKTMAALVNGINMGQSERIATIEEPAHYFYPKSKSYIEQKQVAIDAPDFGPALELVLRNDADVVALSDISDPDTFSTVLEAAERKVLFCRVTARAPAEAIRKIVGLFPEADQISVRSRLAQNLAGIISLKGLPAKSGEGTVVAAEVLEWRRELSDVIVDPDKTASISEILGKYDARASFVDSVEKLYEEGLISQETRTRHAATKSEGASFLDRESAIAAFRMIGEVAATAEVGKTYIGKVVRVAEYGAWVEIFPGTDGLLHISEIAEEPIRAVRDELKEGDQVLVKVLAIEGNKIRLSRKALLREQRDKQHREPSSASS